MFAVFAFKINVSIWQCYKKDWSVCELGTVLLFNMYSLQNLPSDSKSYRTFPERGPRSECWFIHLPSRQLECKGKVTTKEHKCKKLCFKYLNVANYVRSVILESENDILFTCNMNTSCLFVGSQVASTYCRSIPARIHYHLSRFNIRSVLFT